MRANVAGNASSWGLYFLLCASFYVFFPARPTLSLRICSSSAARPSARQIGLHRLPNTCSFPLKRVFPLFFSPNTPHSRPVPLTTLLRQGVVPPILTNPIWVVKVRTFTASPNSPAPHCGLWSAFAVLFSVSVLLSSVGPAGEFHAIFPRRGLGQALSWDVARAGRREKRRAAVHGI